MKIVRKCFVKNCERRNHIREGIKEIYINQRNLKVNLRVNQVSNVIPS